ncbi:MAG: CHAT domain-containing tetratricopeptide repeat protein [Cyanobacteria bacterium J06597_16]
MDTASVMESSADNVQDLFEQGLAAYRSSRFQSAIELWEQALLLADSPQQQAQTLGNLAIAHYETGQYLKALETNQQALALFTALDNPSAVGQVHSNLGNVYEALGKYDQAIAAYEESTAFAQSNNRRRAEGVSIGNLGYVYSLQGERAAALDALQQALAIAREIGDKEGESHRLLNLGITYHALNAFDQAKEAYRLSIEVAKEIGNAGLEANTLINLALALAEDDQHDDAIAALEKSLAIASSLQDPALTAMTLNNLGHTLLAAGRLDDAEARLREAISNLDNLRNDLEDTYTVSLFDTQIYTYNLLTQILIAKQQPEAALEVSEAGRARAFSALLKNRSEASAPSPSSDTVSTPQPSPTDPNSTSLTAAPSLDTIRHIARKTNATLVEYSLVPDEAFRTQGKQRGRTAEIHIWVVQPNGKISFHSQTVDPHVPIESLLSSFRNSIGIRSRGFALANTSNNEELTRDHLQQLYQLLIAPIKAHLPSDPEENVIFIPQGELFQVPFPALIDQKGDFLIEHHTLLTAPSIQILDFTQQRQIALTAAADNSPNKQQAQPLIVGNPTMPEIWDPKTEQPVQLAPLPGAHQEALKIAGFFSVEALTGLAASEKSVKERISNASIVHLATHGLLDYGDPQSTGINDTPGALAFSITDGQDGLLTSAEIQNDLSLSAQLVVLSACDTGRGAITGDGVIGLARAFIAAGTPSVLVSLWAVPDAPTAELMVSFYQELDNGNNKAQALRKAMLSTLKDHPEPKNWAAFTLIGEAE